MYYSKRVHSKGYLYESHLLNSFQEQNMLNLGSHISILPFICMPFKDKVKNIKNTMLVVCSFDSPVLSLNDSFNKFVERH